MFPSFFVDGIPPQSLVCQSVRDDSLWRRLYFSYIPSDTYEWDITACPTECRPSQGVSHSRGERLARRSLIFTITMAVLGRYLTARPSAAPPKTDKW